MRLYAGASTQFIEDNVRNQIAEKLRSAYFQHFRSYPSPSEVSSWRNSLRAMSQVVDHSALFDHGILLEYQLPLTSRRLDFLICGKDQAGHDNAVIVELKQWEGCKPAEGENEVLTWLAGAEREVLHPSAQVGRYQMYLQDAHPAYYEPPDPVVLSSCSYLHNYTSRSNDPLFAEKFHDLLTRSPTFTADDYDPLSGFLRSSVAAGHGLEVLKRVEENRYRPSRKLMDHVGGIIKGRSDFVLLDDQLLVFDKVFSAAKAGFHDRRKTVLIVRGGPGTGKSLIAINLMADLLLKGYNAHYATGSRAFTETLRKVIGSRGAVQFKYFNGYVEAEANSIDVLICDEAHRIRKISADRFRPRATRSGLAQVDEIMRAGKVTVFLIDDDQVVRPDEIGSVAYLRHQAEAAGCSVVEYELETQFRCSGSEAFVNWVNNTLGIKRTANVLWEQDDAFEFRIIDNPNDLEQAVRQKVGQGFTGRVVAGFCWPWSKDTNSDWSLKEDVVIGDYRRSWNARPETSRLARGIPKSNLWAYDPNGLEQIGCVYTAQGFEFDYVGVIFGDDLVYDFKQQSWVGHAEKSKDHTVKRSKNRFIDLVKNTYRVLLTRGMKGCYVSFVDKDTERFFRTRLENGRSFRS